jgi:DNA-binding LacI/PurR family transcriptional regulator
MGRLAAKRLIALIEGAGPLPAIAPVSGELIVRASCGAPRKEAE